MNMNKLMKQAQQMQAKMAQVQEELAQKTVEATAGGGVVKIVANGQQEIVDITIDPSAVDPEDVEMLEDLILAATNEVLRKVQELSTSEMAKITGGLNIPGMF